VKQNAQQHWDEMSSGRKLWQQLAPDAPVRVRALPPAPAGVDVAFSVGADVDLDGDGDVDWDDPLLTSARLVRNG